MIKLPFNRAVRLVCAVLFCALMTACSDSSTTNSSGVQPTLSSLWDNLFTGCGVNCHTSTAADGTELGPDMSTKANFYAQVVGRSVASDYPNWASVKTGDCDTVNFITAGNANESTLAAALISSVSSTLSTAHSCTTTYNYHNVNNQAISDSTLSNALITWINNGAQNN
jgi:hypothetical protein